MRHKMSLGFDSTEPGEPIDGEGLLYFSDVMLEMGYEQCEAEGCGNWFRFPGLTVIREEDEPVLCPDCEQAIEDAKEDWDAE